MSLTRTRTLWTALSPSRHLVASTSTAIHANPFSSSATTRAPISRSKGAVALANMVDKAQSTLPDLDQDTGDTSGTILSNLPTNGVISPQHLAPEHLLTPYLPKSDLTLAYPLGPPVSAARTLDPFVRFGISPLASPMNPYLRTEFCTTMGKIKSRGKTGLQRSSQRQMGKAVRRARSMGIVATFGRSLPER